MRKYSTMKGMKNKNVMLFMPFMIKFSLVPACCY